MGVRPMTGGDAKPKVLVYLVLIEELRQNHLS